MEKIADFVKKESRLCTLIFTFSFGALPSLYGCESASNPDKDTHTDSDAPAEVADGETEADSLPDGVVDPTEEDAVGGDALEDSEDSVDSEDAVEDDGALPPDCPEQEGPLTLPYTSDYANTTSTPLTFTGPGGEDINADGELLVSIADDGGMTYLGECQDLDGDTTPDGLAFVVSDTASHTLAPQAIVEIGNESWSAEVPEGDCGALPSDATPLQVGMEGSTVTTQTVTRNADSPERSTRAQFTPNSPADILGIYVDGSPITGAVTFSGAGFTPYMVFSKLAEGEWTIGLTTFLAGEETNDHDYTGTVPEAASRLLAVYSVGPEDSIMYGRTVVPPSLEYHCWRCVGQEVVAIEFDVEPTCRVEGPCGCVGDGVIPVIENAWLDVGPFYTGYYSIDSTSVLPIAAMSGSTGKIIANVRRTNRGSDEGEGINVYVYVNYHFESEHPHPDTGMIEITPTEHLLKIIDDPCVDSAECRPNYEGVCGWSPDPPSTCTLDM